MRILKKGRIYFNEGQSDWSASHAHKPAVHKISDNLVRIYFGVRDKLNIRRTTFIDVDSKDPSKIIYEHNQPCLDIGPLGTFDDMGVNVSCVINKDNALYMFYIG